MKISVFTVITSEFTPEEVVKRLAHLRYEGVEWRVVTVLKENEQETSFWKGNKCTLSLEDFSDIPTEKKLNEDIEYLKSLK